MTIEAFRKAALTLPGAVESAHMNHPDFRVGGRIFATLGYPDAGSGMVKLTPEQQASFIDRSPEAFEPCAGAWGRNGATSVHLAFVQQRVLLDALATAFKNVAAADQSRRKVKKQPRRSGA